MSRNKELSRKVKLCRACKSNRRVPGWVMIRTNRNFLRHPKRRHWRRGSLKI
jgi:large subunit ribosomal protein L39e